MPKCFLNALIKLGVKNLQRTELEDVVFEKKYDGELQRPSGFEEHTYYSSGLWKDSKALHDTNINIIQDESFECFLSLNNCMGEKKTFTVLILDCYNQVDFIVDNNRLTECTVSLKNGENIEIPISVDKLDIGTHNLKFLILLDAYANPNTKTIDSLSSTDSILQCNVIVSEDTIESVPQTDASSDYSKTFFSTDSPLQFKSSSTISDGISIVKENNQYYIKVGNLSDSVKKGVLILFDNYKQIPLELKSSSQNYGYFELDSQKEFLYPIDLTMDLDDRTDHLLSAVCIYWIDDTEYACFSERIHLKH